MSGHLIKLILAILLIVSTGRAEYVIQLRGVINVETWKAALLEIDRFPTGNTNKFRPYQGDTLLINEGQKILDTNSGTPITIELVSVDAEHMQVILRDDNVDKSYNIPPGQGMQLGQMKLALVNAPLDDTADVYSILAGRTVLVHPQLETTISVGLFSAWEKTPTRVAEARALENYLQGKGATIVSKGQNFALLIPSSKNQNATQYSPPVVSGPPVQPFTLEDTIEAVKMYAILTGQDNTGDNVKKSHLYFRAIQPISKSEAIYAIETLLNWGGIDIVKGPNKTFSTVQRQNPLQ